MDRQIDKQLALNMLKTLSALEALILSSGKSISMIAPDYLIEDLNNHVDALQQIILKGE